MKNIRKQIIFPALILLSFLFGSGTILKAQAENIAPTASLASISPSPANEGDNITFTGAGSDSDGTIASYEWSSDKDGIIGSSDSFQKSTLSVNTHIISLKVKDNDGSWSDPVTMELVVNRLNVKPTSSITSISPNPANEGDNITFTGAGTDSDGTIDSYEWSSDKDGIIGSSDSFQKSTLSADTHIISLRVKDNNDAWSSSVTREMVVAVDPPTQFIIDNADGPSSVAVVGEWVLSTNMSATRWGANYLHDNKNGKGRKSVTFTPTLPVGGQYRVAIWYSADSNRPTAVPMDIISNAGTNTVIVNQRINGGQWFVLGEYPFDAGIAGKVRIRNNGTNDGYVIADAVRFSYIGNAVNVKPTSSITSIAPNPANEGDNITFTGSGTDTTPGTVTGYSWRSSRDGVLSAARVFQKNNLSTGAHTIYLKVQDNEGLWSEEVSQELWVGQTTEIIIDNGASGVSFTGTWTNSTSSGRYGANSLYAYYDSSYSWHTSLPQSGRYKVYMWWTASPTRMTYAPVTISHSGAEDTVLVDQTMNGGKWNLMGVYDFDNTAGGTITIKALSPDIYTTCADAVRFVYIPAGTNAPPVAFINSISPNPAAPSNQVKFSGQGSDIDGTITGCSWRSSIDGVLGSSAVLNKTNLSTGTHTIYFRVQDNSGNWSEEASTRIKIDSTMTNTEHIYIVCGYDPSVMKPDVEYFLRNLGAAKDGMIWVYRNSQGKTHFMHIIDDPLGMKRSLATENAHVIVNVHSNYGMGTVFGSEEEISRQSVNNLRYMDDERLQAYCSKTFRFNLRSVRTSHSFPVWWPKFKDGTSSIMPYGFGDQRGDPPYNYYLTYQVPGDPAYYRVETVRNSAIERFPDCGKPAWYSATGQAPDSGNLGDRQYFITNSASWSPDVQVIGDWTEVLNLVSSYGGTYQRAGAGSGENQFRFYFTISTPGDYTVYSWWPVSSGNTEAARYTIRNASGSSVVYADQSINGGRWNSLGQYHFNSGKYWVLLDNYTAGGNVCADGISVQYTGNPPQVIAANFRGNVFSGPAPLTVGFTNQSIGNVASFLWDFGDGETDNADSSPSHTYTQTGTYTVTLTLNGSAGQSVKAKTNYITVGSSGVLKAEFRDDVQEGEPPLAVSFNDISAGNITSRLWTFGDGETSTERNPDHVYDSLGNYTVTLRVTDNHGNASTETKTNYIRVARERNVDNVDYPKAHYGSNIIGFRGEQPLSQDDFRYSRLFYISCNSGIYYIDTFHRGKMFYTLDNASETVITVYLNYYLKGNSDAVIWQKMQATRPAFDYYDFNKAPSEQ